MEWEAKAAEIPCNLQTKAKRKKEEAHTLLDAELLFGCHWGSPARLTDHRSSEGPRPSRTAPSSWPRQSQGNGHGGQRAEGEEKEEL